MTCLFLCSFFSFAQNYHSILYQGDFDRIPVTVKSLQLTFEDSYYLAWTSAVNCLITRQESDRIRFKNIIQEISAKHSGESVQDKYIRAEIVLLESVVDYQNEEELSALWGFRSAYFKIRNILKEDPTFMPARKSIGMIELALSTVPAEYQWLLDLLGLKFSFDDGEASILSIPMDFYMYTETQLFYSFYQSYMLQEYEEAITRVKLINKVKGQLPIAEYALLAIYNKQGNGSMVIQNFKGSIPIAHAYFLVGEAYLQRANYRESRRYFELFNLRNKNTRLSYSSNYKMYISYLLEGNLSAGESFKKIALEGQLIYGSIDQYGILNRSIDEGDLDLLKARLFTDGGYYKEAEQELVHFANVYPQRTETSSYLYRRARLFHLTGDFEKSLIYYNKVIEKPFDGEYYAPNSCLQAGTILIEKGETEKALDYLERVTEYSSHPYKKSLDRKARALISGIKGK